MKAQFFFLNAESVGYIPDQKKSLAKETIAKYMEPLAVMEV